MDYKKLHTVREFELADGSKIKLSLAFYLLYQLRSKRKDIYDKYNKIMQKGPEEELQSITVLYTAYLCANLSNLDECMDEETFLMLIPDDRKTLGLTVKELVNPKKK